MESYRQGGKVKPGQTIKGPGGGCAFPTPKQIEKMKKGK